jgi:hypothetical protein
MNVLTWCLCVISFFSVRVVFACGDLDFACKQREGQLNLPIPTPPRIDPECRSDLCKAAEGTVRETGRAVENVARELGKTPQAIQECLTNVTRCTNEIMSSPVALLAQAYIDGLYRQSEGRVQSFSPQWIELTKQYYDVDLNGVTFAENIDTGHGMTLAYCDRIFFTHSGSPWTDKSEMFLTLHEMEHLVQCQKRGRRTFLAEYILKGLVNMAKNGRFNIHDIHEFEVAADAKANNLTDLLWNRVHSNVVPVPTQPRQQQGFPSGYVTLVCGCWGPNSVSEASEPRCQSQNVSINWCQGFCPGGGIPYAYVCQ